MLDIFIDLATAAMSIGSVTAASMSANGLIAIDGVVTGGKTFHLTFRFDDGSVPDGSENP